MIKLKRVFIGALFRGPFTQVIFVGVKLQLPKIARATLS